MKHTTESIVAKIKPILGEEYDYSEVKWVDWNTKLTIKCDKHGKFTMFPGEISSPSSRRSKKCPACSKELVQSRYANSIVNRFIQVHGEKYDYSAVKYLSMREKVIVICSKHGDFWPSPQNHLLGHGCPGCFSSGPSSQETEWLDALERKLEVHIQRSVPIAGYRVVVDGLLGNIAIEFDGGYWHSKLGGLERDTRKTEQVIAAGYQVIRLRGSSFRSRALTEVPGACNVFVSEKVSLESLTAAVAAIQKVMTIND